ncbi:MAG: ATP-binding protein [Prochloraceae cyanobacterium]|nr:ATP-binding protein [Prochloraceae cyanobacterium]
MKVPLFNSLRFKMPSLVLAAILPLMLLAIFYAGNRATKTIRSEAKENLSLKGNILAESVSSWERSNNLALRSLANQKDIVSMNPERQQSVLSTFVEIYEHFYLAITIAPDGQNIARSDRNELKNDLQQNYFKTAISGKTGQEVVIDSAINQPALCLSAPILREEVKIVGVTAICTDLNAIAAQVGELKFSQTGYAFIVDDEGQLLAHPNSKLLSSSTLKDFSYYPPVQAFLANKPGHSYFENLNKEWVAYTKPLDNGWGVIVIQDKEEFLTSERQFANLVWAIALITVAGVSSVTWLVANHAIGPVDRLTKEAISIAQGQLNRKVRVDRKDELGILAKAFNHMAAQLRYSFSHLEERIDKRTVELKQALVAAESANKAKDRFLANVSQELRAPLNSILGYTGMLLSDPNLEPDRVLNLRIVKQSGTHLLTLINDILDFSKTQTTKIQLYPDDLNFSEFLEEIVGIIEMRAREKELFFEAIISSNIATGIKADAKRLRQVILNLLGNAVKFTYSGKVTFKVKVIDEFCSTETKVSKQTIRFEVIDTGVGISREEINRIFQPFEKVEETKRNSHGTGLGLSISRELVELMGSKIEVNSKIGEGSIFAFNATFDLVELEVADREKSQTTIVQKVGYKGPVRKILVVDDRSNNRALLIRILEPLGFKVIEASHGQEGFEKACKHHPDIILTDLLMPVKSGLMMVLELREMPEFRNTPTIALSASNQEMMERKSDSVGCNAFLQKPFEEERLMAYLELFLNLEWIYQEVSIEGRAKIN